MGHLSVSKKIKTKKTSHDVVWVANGFYAAVELDPYPLSGRVARLLSSRLLSKNVAV